MKKVLLSLAVAAASLTASAQTTIYTEDFEDILTTNAKQWSSFNVNENGPNTDNPNWFPFEGAPVFGGTVFMASETSDGAGNYNTPFPGNGAVINVLTSMTYDGNFPAANTVQSAEITFQTFRPAPASPLAQGEEDFLSIDVYTDVNGEDTYVTSLGYAFDATENTEMTGTITLDPQDIADLDGLNFRFDFVSLSAPDKSNGFAIDDVVFTYTAIPLSVKELNNGEFAVYPNPAVNELTIANTNALAINTVNVLDITGKTVKTFNFNGSKVSQTVSIADLNTGVYFVQVNATEGTSVLRVAKK